jgi:RNA polymerase sigma factor (sigma-70 family)
LPAAERPAAAVEAVWRIEAARVVAALVRAFGDVGVAEDAAQDALVAALDQWPRTGVPDNPGAWLLTVARRRGVDTLRRQTTLDRTLQKHGASLAAAEEFVPEARVEPGLDDDVLQLLFLACSPAVPTGGRLALTLRAVAGLTTEEIARAFLVPPTTVGQRIVRAKRALAGTRFAAELPSGAELRRRLDSVLTVVYLLFNEGYVATAGEHWTRPDLCAEALRLARTLAGLAPDDAEVHGLLALLELQTSRLSARTDGTGAPVLLDDQDRSRWDRLSITRGLAALARAERLAGRRGSYTLQAAIAACHARSVRAADTDWARIAALYGELSAGTGSPVVELNRAVAVSRADGAEAGLAIVDLLSRDPRLSNYHLLPAVRGDLLARLGRAEEAAAEFTRAAEATANAREREVLLGRARRCAQGSVDPR